MGKRRVQGRQPRQQIRQIRPKGLPRASRGAAPGSTDQRAQKRQRERYVQAGGVLQGYAPERVERIAYAAVGGAAGCLLVMAVILAFIPYGWPVRIVAALVWVVPIVFAGSFILPGFRLARKDRQAEARVVRGDLMGASEVSTALGLGMLMLRTRAGTEQYLVPPDRLARVPGNQVSVMLQVTPHLRHVRNLTVMGQRVVGRPEQPVPAVVRRLRLLPILTPAALCLSAIVGTDAVAFSPIHPDALHAALALVAGALCGGAAYLAMLLAQRRLYADVQKLIPGGLA